MANIPSIGILAYAIDREAGGISRYSRELVRAMCRLHPDLYLLSAMQRQGNAIRLPGSGHLPGLLTLGQAQITFAARRHHLELIHDPAGICPFMLTDIPTVVSLHDAFPFVPHAASSAAERVIYRLWLPLVLPRAGAVLTLSQRSKDDILRYLRLRNDQVTIIPLAANNHFRPMSPAEFQPALDRHGIQPPYILYVGSLEPRKNLLRLLQAYARLASSRPPLVIVGARNFWKSSPVVETVAQLGLEQQVRFTGYVEDADLPALYAAAKVFVFPSLYEGFGLPVLEAMACGTPVVTSNNSSLPEVAGDAALMVDPNDVDSIAAAMQRVLNDPELAADLRERGLARAAQFSWERTARETLAVYEKVLGKA